MKQNTNRYYIIGMPGVGKTRLLSQFQNELHIDCTDLDTLIESKYNSTIPKIIQEKGVELFRLYEAVTLRELPQTDQPTLIACGGGTPCYHDNMVWINQSGISIYLECSPHSLKQKYQNYQINRPLRGDDDLNRYIDTLFEQRLKFYEQSHLTIDLDFEGDNLSHKIKKIIQGNSANIG